MTDETTAKRARSTYVGERIRTLQAEIKDLRTEQREITAALRSDDRDPKSAEAKTLKHRRIYTATRQAEARTELDGLRAERPARKAADGGARGAA
jgi:hypothetical protein